MAILVTGGAGYVGSHVAQALIDRGGDVPTREVARRAGDFAEVVADPTRLKRELAWCPKHDDLEESAATAYEWEKRSS